GESIDWKEGSAYVVSAWLVSQDKYIGDAIERRFKEDLREFALAILPALAESVTIILGLTALGALAGPGGAAVGFRAGMAAVTCLGAIALIDQLRKRLVEGVTHLMKGIELAWNSCGNWRKIDQAAEELAEFVATFVEIVVAAVIAFLLKKGL